MYLPSGTSRSKPFRLFRRTPRRRMHSSFTGVTAASGEDTRLTTRRAARKANHGEQFSRSADITLSGAGKIRNLDFTGGDGENGGSFFTEGREEAQKFRTKPSRLFAASCKN